MDETGADTTEHPLETAARALLGGVCTEMAAAFATMAVVASYGGAVGSGIPSLLAHALGVGLGAAVAIAAAERARLRRGLLVAALAGGLLCPLAPLGGWYVLDILDTLDVTLATQGVLAALRGATVGDVGWLAGVALVGYGSTLVARARGVGLVGQVVAGAWALAALGAAATALDAVEGSWPLRAWTAVLASRAVALPLGLALGGALGARGVRALRRDPAPPRARRPLHARSALLVLPLLVAASVVTASAPGEPLEVTRARWLAGDDSARHALGWDLARESLRELGAVLPPASSWRRVTRATPRWTVVTGRGGAPTGAMALQLDRPLLVGPPALVSYTAASTPVVSLHASAAACLRAPAAAGRVDAMSSLAMVLEQGTRFEYPTEEASSYYSYRRYGWHVPSRAELDEALRWWRRAAEEGSPFAQRELGRRLLHRPAERDAGLAWLRRAHAEGDGEAAHLLAVALLEPAPHEALAWARLAARRSERDLDLLRQILHRHPHLRDVSDDGALTTHADLQPVAADLAALPWSTLRGLEPTSSGDPAADALARAARALGDRQPHVARALAIAALRRRPGQRTASLLLIAHHQQAASASDVSPDHMAVAESYLDATWTAQDALEPWTLAAGGLCDVARALLVPELDVGWARRAWERLTAADLLSDDPRIEHVRTQAEGLLLRRGLRDRWSTAELLDSLARRNEQAARQSSDQPEVARAYRAAAARLRQLAGESPRGRMRVP